MSDRFEKDILEKLDIIIRLLSIGPLDKDAPQTEAIISLRQIGLKPKQIANVLNTTQNYVNMILSKSRKEKK